MKDEYVMGIDNGGTVTKAAIYDRKGQVLAIASKSSADADTPGIPHRAQYR